MPIEKAVVPTCQSVHSVGFSWRRPERRPPVFWSLPVIPRSKWPFPSMPTAQNRQLAARQSTWGVGTGAARVGGLDVRLERLGKGPDSLLGGTKPVTNVPGAKERMGGLLLVQTRLNKSARATRAAPPP